jgi:hypothetical protein
MEHRIRCSLRWFMAFGFGVASLVSAAQASQSRRHAVFKRLDAAQPALGKIDPVPTLAPVSQGGAAMHRFALLLSVALALLATSAVAQDCDNFTDVPASSPFCPDVTWLTSFGITKGCGGSQFCPNETVTRLQMAAFMHRLGENAAFVNGGNAFGVPSIIGNTQYNSLTLTVGNQPAIVVQPVVDPIFGYNPNVIAGQSGNKVGDGIAGATIAGGGGCNPSTGGTCATPFANTVIGSFGSVLGGTDNTAGYYSTVAGGSANMATGNDSAVAGGVHNTASGTESFVAGGSGNTASGALSFAAGENANATDDHSFVWGDGSQAANSTGVNTFSVLATGGIGLFPGGATVGIYDGGWSCTVSNGSTSWACSSDRKLKENFKTLDQRDVLRRVVAMPVTSWTFIGHPERLHIGPVAQDFHASFGLGDPKDDTHIDLGDSQGVALAAIQGLNAKVEDQALTIGALQREIAELRERLSAAESLRGELAALRSALAEVLQERLAAAQRN